MSALKSEDERDVINACIRMRRLRSRSLRLDQMTELVDRGLVNRDVLLAFAHGEFMAGFRDGVDDANGVEA